MPFLLALEIEGEEVATAEEEEDGFPVGGGGGGSHVAFVVEGEAIGEGLAPEDFSGGALECDGVEFLGFFDCGGDEDVVAPYAGSGG